MRLLLLSIFAFTSITKLYAQVHKEECIYGDCRNGFGMLRIYGNKNDQRPQPFHSPITNMLAADQFYLYYQIGEFKNKQLNGNGYRINAGWDRNDKRNVEWLYNAAVNHSADTSLSKYTWFEKGNYVNGKLQGRGIQIERDVMNRRINIVREGMISNNLLNGAGTKMTSDVNGFITTKKDSATGKISLVQGRLYSGSFENDQCIQCTVTELHPNAGMGSMTGAYLDDQLFCGWVIQDYTRDTYSGKMINTTPFRALYIGGILLKKLEGTDISDNTRTIILEDGNTYTGETDKEGRPFGFGKMTLYGNKDWVYEGFVDNGKPEGWGLTRLQNNPLQPVIGGLYRNGTIIHGAVIKPGTELNKVVIAFGTPATGEKGPGYDHRLHDIVNGPYTRSYYTYYRDRNRYIQTRVESGEKVNGYEKSVWVHMGQTEAEKKRQRKVVNGMISISDVITDDILVIEGKASPIVNKVANVYYLKNGKLVSSMSASQVQLSRHSHNEFFIGCTECSGKGQVTYMYQRAPETVSYTSTRVETEVGDLVVWRKTITETRSYTKTYPPEQRLKSCGACKGLGKTQDFTEINE